MIAAALSALLLAPGDLPPRVTRYAQLTIRQSVIVRVPTRHGQRAPRIAWKTRRGPRCLPMDSIAGAAVLAPDSVDMILRGGERLRAEFSASCPALDFYSGFYVLPTADRRICADRDSVHARSGGECAIKRLRRLVPVAAPPAKPSGVERTRARVAAP